MSNKSGWPPRFSVNESGVLDLFTGDRFYSSSDASLREAILNAIDACGRRCSSAGQGYTPKIDVIFDTSDNTITVRDNGDGMNQNEITDLFTEVASSAAEILRDSNNEYQSVGEFGIGVLSYFLVCSKYEIHSVGDSGDPIGIRLTDEMLDAKTHADRITPDRSSKGTTLVLAVRDDKTFNHLKDRYPHWIRDVEYLSATLEPSGETIQQGELTTGIDPIALPEYPEWAEKVRVGPPSTFSTWEHLDGNGNVDLLYRGVFVENIEPPKLWGLEGAIHVDPKKFKAKLNREEFIGNEDKNKINRFLKDIHPSVIENAIQSVDDIDFDSKSTWDKTKWVNVWLAIPRNDEYQGAANVWDAKFQDLEAFELLLPDDNRRSVSVDDITGLDADEVFVAPPNFNRLNDIDRQAVRVLRARDVPVIKGHTREGSYLRNASYIGNSSQDILNYFSDDLPTLVDISARAEEIIRTEHKVAIFSQAPKVLVVELGTDGSSLIEVSQEVWINLDTSDGKQIIKEVCDRNEGYAGLWLACLKYAPDQASRIARILRGSTGDERPLGIVKRQYLRKIIT